MKSRCLIPVFVVLSFFLTGILFSACNKKSETQAQTSSEKEKALKVVEKFEKMDEGANPEDSLKLIDEALKALPKAVASVNNVKIMNGAIKVALERLKLQADSHQQAVDKEQITQIINQIFEAEIQREVLFQRGKELAIEVSTGDVDKIIEMMKKRFNSEEEFLKELSRSGLTLEMLKEINNRNMIVSKLIQKEVNDKIEINDQQAMDFYKKNEKSFVKPETIRASHILFKVTNEMSDDEKKAARGKTEDVLKKAKAGEDFAELAKKYSEGPSASRGGDLNDVAKGQMVPKFEEALFKLNTGEISDIVETQFGYHIIKAFDRKAGGGLVPFDQAKENILNFLKRSETQQKAKIFIEDLEKKADIKRFL